MSYRAEYKKVTGELVDIEFEHDFDSQSMTITQARDLTHDTTIYQIYLGYLIYSSIRELHVV